MAEIGRTIGDRKALCLRFCVILSQVCALYQGKTKLRVRSPRVSCTGRRPTGTLPSVAAAPLTLTYWDYLPRRLGG